MTAHLSQLTLNALADGELSARELAGTKDHLDSCAACTKQALQQALLKTATARTGQRYSMPSETQNRMKRLLQHQPAEAGHFAGSPSRIRPYVGWIAAAVLLVASLTWFSVQRATERNQLGRAHKAALVAEICDLHIATLAANLPPQVVSSDRHTVKPWFQGKLPYSFNLPENLPADIRLEGANLTYLQNRPVAQLLYEVGKHRASVFVRQAGVNNASAVAPEERSGFQISEFRTRELDVLAITDADRAHLNVLTAAIQQAQAPPHLQ